jgi:hypothetical protein
VSVVASEMCGVDRGGGPLVADSACCLLELNYRNPSCDNDDPRNRYRQVLLSSAANKDVSVRGSGVLNHPDSELVHVSRCFYWLSRASTDTPGASTGALAPDLLERFGLGAPDALLGLSSCSRLQ